MKLERSPLPPPSSAISPLNKGLGSFGDTSSTQEIARLGWNVLKEDLSLPSAVLYQEALENNLDWMQQFIAAYGLRLAPHGKTTMAPKLFDMQLRSGAWGITLATAHQTQVAYAHGVRRILMANQLVGKQNRSIIAQMLRDPTFEFYCLVDSAALIDQLGEYFSAQGLQLHVLLELGPLGGRTGVRDDMQLQDTLTALSRWKPAILLSGVEVYEGVLKEEAAIREFLRRAVSVSQNLLRSGNFQQAPFILTGAGSAWYDVVAEEFSSAGFGHAAEVVLRPGCYLTHDVGAYRESQHRIVEHNSVAAKMRSRLRPALQVWAYVQSIPEPEKAIITMGKRDAAFDSGLPTPALRFRPGDSAPRTTPEHWQLTKMMDQHAYLEIAPGDDLRVGDMIGFDISHPCLTFDKWRTLPVLNSKFQVVDLVQTYF